MKKFSEFTKEELFSLKAELDEKYEEYSARGLKLDLSRGKPNSNQLDISQGLLNVDMKRESCFGGNGFDYRNYGILDGIPEMKRFFAEVYGLAAEDIIVGGNSSLQLMYDTLARAMMFGVYGSPRPWCKEEKIKWICVVPGYDRHFKVTETLGFELVSVNMTADGPDMDEVERLVCDPAVKGMWCVPKYSNPTGNTYSDETVRRLAKMKCAAPDFRIMWDNAYAVHDFSEDKDELLDIFAEAEKYGNRDRIFYFSSTSKITFPGSGVSFVAMSENNRRQVLKYLGVQTIGFDKLNQLRHLAFFENADGLYSHMMKHGAFVKEKFDIVESELNKLSGLGIAEWTKPKGGYFISLDTPSGCASRVFELMKGAGVTLTGAGDTFPYGRDPEDKNLRLAPTYPSNDELRLATEILVLTVKLAAVEKYLAQ